MATVSQREHSRANKAAWSHRAYEAWLRGYGPPAEAAAKICQNPDYILRQYANYLGDLKGKAVANLLGSHGRRAVAMALLGAEVTVVDISEENKRYAQEVAQEAGVSLNYIVSDLMEWSTEPFGSTFDFVLMELGILHYFVNLDPLARLINSILKPGGKLVLHEFHPMNRKFVPAQDGDRLVLEGDYFSEEILEKPAPTHVAFSSDEVDSFPLCRVRYWQLGEIVSAVSASGLIVETLVEKPHKEYSTLPGTFTLVAKNGS